jgi:glycosyltransferase involved in cell wall biosynthesis
MPKVFVLTEVYYPETASTSYLLTQTAEGLKQEFDVQVITGPASRFLDVIEYDKNFEYINGVPVHRCSGTRFNKDNLIGRIINMLTRSVAIFIGLLRRCSSDDVILVVTSPPALPFAAYFANLLKRVRYVVLLHDVYPEVMEAVGVLKSDSLVSRLLRRANGRLYRRAVRVIAIGRDMAALAAVKLRGEKDNIVVIPNWADTDVIRPLPKSESSISNSLGTTEGFAILYAGNLSRANAIDTIAHAALQLAPYPGIKFVFVGYGARKAWLQEFVSHHRLSNVHILPPMPRERQLDFLNCADVALATLLPNMTGVSVPSRTYSFMAAGKPILALCGKDSELGLCVTEERIGWVIDPDDVGGLVSTILEARDNKAVLSEMACRAVKCAAEKYSREHALARYRDLFREIIK